MLRSLETAPELVEIFLDDERVKVPAGVSLAAALLYLDAIPTRYSDISATPRAPFCMMGQCFECLVEIDAGGRQRGCMTAVRAGMRIRRQREGGPPA